MKRCDICNEDFNCHEETTCKKCREESRAVSLEMYLECRGIIKEFEVLMREFVDKYEVAKRLNEPQCDAVEDVLVSFNNKFNGLLSKIESH